ncbi:MAG: hypothetical protein L6R28_25110, partial [Planctomycetes bacterium]|nr:hypothetical protein [Planctomycetota bacterium]
VCASGRADLIAQMDSSEISIAQAYRVLEAETRPKAPDVTPIDDDANEPEPAAKGPASDSKAGPAAAPPQEAGAASCGSVPQADGAPTTAPPVPDVVTGAGAPAARIVEQADCVVVYLPRAAWQAALLDIAEPSEKFEKMVSQGLIVLWDGDSRMSQDPAPMAAPAQATQAE